MTGSTRPPLFSGIAKAPQEPWREPEPVDYTKGGHQSPAERGYRPNLTQIPGAVRRDFIQAHKLAAHQQFGPADDGLPDMVSWDDLTAVSERFSGSVDFPAPSMGVWARVNYLGQSIPRTRNGLR